MLTAAQTSAMLKATGGVEIRFGNATTYGHVDTDDTMLFAEQMGVQGARVRVTIAQGSLEGVARGSTITVAGTQYVVREPPQRVDDGGLQYLWLTNVTA